MRSDIPPPGRAMTFPDWAEAIVAGVRVFLPDAKAVRKGPRYVIIQHGGREAHLRDDGAAFWISFPSATIATTMFDDQRDVFTVNNLARSIAGYFDARFTRAENP
jgi:hypothetical protein